MEGLFRFPAQNSLKRKKEEGTNFQDGYQYILCINTIVRLMHNVDAKHLPVIPLFFLSSAFSN